MNNIFRIQKFQSGPLELQGENKIKQNEKNKKNRAKGTNKPIFFIIIIIMNFNCMVDLTLNAVERY